jgi:hypothetical protein
MDHIRFRGFGASVSLDRVARRFATFFNRLPEDYR